MTIRPASDRSLLLSFGDAISLDAHLAVARLTRGGTPAPVTIDEALELARKFSGEDSVQFVNGVLDAVRREMT